MTWQKEINNRTPLNNKWLAGNLILLLIILSHSVYRDLQLEKQYPADLRNRVVGARLQKDGRLPYFYHWQSEDGYRYLDPDNSNQSSSKESNITASPFFHQLLYPVCDLDQRTISRIWLMLQYFLLTGMIWLASRMTGDRKLQLLLLNTGILFTATEAWKSLISSGQIYLVFAFLMMCIISGLTSGRKQGFLFAGICMAVFILSRPISLIICLPLLLLYKRQRLFFLSTFMGLALYGLFVLFSPFEKALWKNYSDGLRLQIILHQSETNTPKEKLMVPKIERLEGFDFAEVSENMMAHPIPVYSENGNVFVIYHALLNKKIPLGILNALSLGTVIGLTVLFYFFYIRNKGQPVQVLLFACTLYMIIEIFGPVHRHQYNTVQWFPLVLTALLICRKWKYPEFLLLLTGLLLNISNVTWLLMRHTLGEFAWLAAILLISFSPAKKLNLPQKALGKN